MQLPFPEADYSVSRLCEELRELVGALVGVWVVGEVQRLRRSDRGHLYFELVEKGARDEIRARLDAVVWRGDLERVARRLAASDQPLTEGVAIRCRIDVDLYPPTGRLQIVVREVDPVFTLGLLEKRRRETLAALAAAGLLELNRSRPLADVPLDLALVTSEGSAAYHDFLATLAESGYGFRVLFVHASVQGRTAERELISALALAARAPVAAIALVRGGGAKSDLAVFDGRALAEAVARCPLPVVSGLGHEIDQAIVDRVAHTAVKTPTKAAELFVERVAVADRVEAELRRALARAARTAVRDGRERLAGAERGVALARLRLQAVARRLAEHGRALARLACERLRGAERRSRELSRRLAARAPRRLAAAGQRPAETGRRLAGLARGRLAVATAHLDGLARLAVQLDPAHTLARGFSVTRDASGRALRSVEELAPGDRLWTTLAQGVVESTVVESTVLVSPEER